MDKAEWLAWAKNIQRITQDLEERVGRLEAARPAPAAKPGSAPFPKTEAELLQAGYSFSGKGTCKACKAELEWWITPRGASAPFDPGTMESHFKTCPEAEQFRNRAQSGGEP